MTVDRIGQAVTGDGCDYEEVRKAHHPLPVLRSQGKGGGREAQLKAVARTGSDSRTVSGINCLRYIRCAGHTEAIRPLKELRECGIPCGQFRGLSRPEPLLPGDGDEPIEAFANLLRARGYTRGD